MFEIREISVTGPHFSYRRQREVTDVRTVTPASHPDSKHLVGELCWRTLLRHMGEERGVYRVLVGKPEGKRPLGRPRRRWVDNIRVDLQEVGCGCMDWIVLAQGRDRWQKLVSAVMNLRVP